jgi:peptide/nickel transport system ATP-binding protein/oligopeptide transport system ATP-binding protein
MGQNGPLLDVRNLHTHYYSHAGVAQAVAGIDLTIGRGETFGLVGESGCGKSVTARSIMRLIRPPGRIVKGQILFDGQDLAALSEKKMRAVRGDAMAMIFQEPMISLNPVFRIGDQIVETIRLHRRMSRRRARDRAEQLLQMVGIPDPAKRLDEHPHQMSGGMRQRVMIAMALSCDPRLIIADEPTTALDVTIQAQILDLMNNLKNDTGASILLISHDLGVIAEMAHNIGVMYAGRIVENGPTEALFEQPLHPYTQGLMASIPKVDQDAPADRMLKTISGIVPSLLDLPPGCAFQERCAAADGRCRPEPPPVVEVEPGRMVRCWHYES